MFTKILRYISSYSPLVTHLKISILDDFPCFASTLAPFWWTQEMFWTLDNDDWVLSMGFVCNYVCVVSSFLRYLRPYLWELTGAPNTGNKAPRGKFCNSLHIVSYTGCFFPLGLPLKCLSTEKLIYARLGVSRTIYVNVDSPHLVFHTF